MDLNTTIDDVFVLELDLKGVQWVI